MDQMHCAQFRSIRVQKETWYSQLWVRLACQRLLLGFMRVFNLPATKPKAIRAWSQTSLILVLQHHLLPNQWIWLSRLTKELRWSSMLALLQLTVLMTHKVKRNQQCSKPCHKDMHRVNKRIFRSGRRWCRPVLYQITLIHLMGSFPARLLSRRA